MTMTPRESPAIPRLSRRSALSWGIAALGHGLIGRTAYAQRLAPLGPLGRDRQASYFIATGPPETRYRSSDRELAVWALEAWQRAAGGALAFVASGDEDSALVRVYWAPAAGGQYGEMLALEVGGKRGAAVFIRPDTDALGGGIAERAARDAVFRDAIVYLTCLHELGHALGLEHTDEFADIMYFFGYGGDIDEYFDRYRRQLNRREDIRGVAGLSTGDIRRLQSLYLTAV